MDVLCQSAGMMWPYLFCHFANLTTDRTMAIGTAVYGLNWFDYPVKMRKYFILLIARSQQRIVFTGLHLFPCTLEVFGQVSNLPFYFSSGKYCPVIFCFIISHFSLFSLVC